MFENRELTSWRLGLLFYSHIVEMSAPYEVLTNLLRFRLGKGYHPNPYYEFLSENDRKRFRRSGLFPKQKIEIIQSLSKEAGLEFGSILTNSIGMISVTRLPTPILYLPIQDFAAVMGMATIHSL